MACLLPYKAKPLTRNTANRALLRAPPDINQRFPTKLKK